MNREQTIEYNSLGERASAAHFQQDSMWSVPLLHFTATSRPHCLTGKHMFVGISERTNKAGAAALTAAFGPSLRVVTVPVASHPAVQADLGQNASQVASACNGH